METVLAKIKPKKAEQEQFKKAVASFLAKLNSELKPQLKHTTAILGGSGSKGTWLSGSHDVDVFVLFDYKKFSPKTAELSELLFPAVKRSFPGIPSVRLHGSRDYFQLKFKGLSFEIIPILHISRAEDALNITDVSPLHSLWVNRHAKRLKDEILLAKQFCKANHCYGAESHIGGFSGYVLEILIVNYDSFHNLLKASLKWKSKEVIDVGKHYRSKEEALFQINASKLQSPLIIIDPVDKSRNAAAALSREKFAQFKKKAAEYLKNPHPRYFEKEMLTVEKVRKMAGRNHALILSITPRKGKRDVVGMKIAKVFEYLSQALHQFELKKSGWEWEEGKDALLYFIVGKKELPEYLLRPGPPLGMKVFVADFQKKNQDTFIKDNHIYARIKTQHPRLEDFTDHLIKSDYVKEKVQEITQI